ncbi:hypothetical protein BG015_000635, partial [Linnemannia schmuckeri]
RYIVTVTLPFIYRDPFNGHGATSIVKSLFAQTLLASSTCCNSILLGINDSTTSTVVHPFLTMRLRQFLPSPFFASSASNTQFDYLRHVRHINQARCGRRGYGSWTSSHFLSSEESTYIEEHPDEVELQGQFDDVTVTIDFANIYEKLEYLTILLSNVQRYRAVVDRLGRQEKICFLQDEVYQLGDIVDEGSRVRTHEAMRNMVESVEAHA